MANQTVDIWNTSTQPSYVPGTVLQAVGSKTELVLLTTYFSFCIVAVLLGNGIVFTTVYKNRVLHTQHYFVLFLYAVCDTVTSVAVYPLAIVILYQGSGVPEWYCRVSSCIGTSAFYSAVYVLDLLALERYHFFCRPLSYERIFSTTKMSCMVAAACIIPLGYALATEVTVGRKVSVAVLGCRLNTMTTLSVMHRLIVCGLGLLLHLWCIIRVGVIWAKMRSKIAPQVVEQGNTRETYLPVEGLSDAYRAKTTKAGAALKLIILVSGLFWGTILPACIIYSAVFSSGATWDEIETRQNLIAVFLLRYRFVLMSTVSQVLNPFLHLYTHPELRSAVKKLLGCCFRSVSPMEA